MDMETTTKPCVVVPYQEQSNPDSSDNTGSGGGSGRVNQADHDKCPGGNSSGGGGGNGLQSAKAKPYSQTVPSVGGDATTTTTTNTRTGLPTTERQNSDLEGGKDSGKNKDSSTSVLTTSGSINGKQAPRKVMPSSSSRSGPGAGGQATGVGRQQLEEQLDHIPTDMSDTSDSEEDKNLE